MNDLNRVWLKTLVDIEQGGTLIAPRGKATMELLHRTVSIDMRYPVLTLKERKLSYQFMAAEAFWILSGDDTVAGIVPWNKHIYDFSDDGKVFFGAYGPKIQSQLPYIVGKLKADPMTRQAGLTIWRENPPATKDVPCTVSIFFNLRNGLLNLHVFMRSSDAWLGLSYDTFNFSMLGHLVCGMLNANVDRPGCDTIRPGTLYLTAVSSHLYEENRIEAEKIVNSYVGVELPVTQRTPPTLYMRPELCLELLSELRDTKPGDGARWWE